MYLEEYLFYGIVIIAALWGLVKLLGWIGHALSVDPDERSVFDPKDQHYVGKLPDLPKIQRNRPLDEIYPREAKEDPK